MSRAISLGLVAAVLVAAAGPAAWGQDASPPGKQSANPSSPASPGVGAAGAPSGAATGSSAGGSSSTGANSGAGASSGAGGSPGGGASSAASAGPGGTSNGGSSNGAKGAGRSKPVCFNLTGRCVEVRKVPATQNHAEAQASASTTADGSSKKTLDLAAPDVRNVVPADELKEPLPSGDQITEVQESQTVAVKGEGPPPDVPLGFGAIWWALNHPSKAWKIFVPVE